LTYGNIKIANSLRRKIEDVQVVTVAVDEDGWKETIDLSEFSFEEKIVVLDMLNIVKEAYEREGLPRSEPISFKWFNEEEMQVIREAGRIYIRKRNEKRGIESRHRRYGI
jgi:hypothetical protein